MKRSILLSSIIFLITYLGYAQQSGFTIPDSLQHKSYDEIGGLARKYSQDSIRFRVYSNTLLAKAKEEKDSLRLAQAYQIISYIYKKDYPTRILYLDSSIIASKSINDKRYPALSYSYRAGVYRQMRLYKKALSDYLLALKYSEKTGNKYFYYSTKHNIGGLKDEIGEYAEAAKMYKEVLSYEDKNNIKDKGHAYTILVLADSYRKLNVLDSATFYNKKGINESLRDSLGMSQFFTLNEGVNLFYKQHYKAALDSLNKAIIIFEKHDPDNEFLIGGYLHRARLYKQLNNKEILLHSLEDMDRYYHNTGFASLDMREGYEMFVNYYKAIGDKDKQLHYINKLFMVDSVMDISHKNLNKKIVLEYDTPRLLAEKQVLIEALEKKEKQANTKFVAVLILVILLIIVFVFIYSKNLRYKKRFKEIMNAQHHNSNASKKNISTPESIGISDDLVKDLLQGLSRFEDEHGYLSANISSRSLAKKLNTNSKYLSKVINAYKQKNFNGYINELRVDYVIDKLKREPKFRLFTIKAIAQDIGFNTTEAFSKSFYKKTKIYPSYFIKQLEKKG